MWADAVKRTRGGFQLSFKSLDKSVHRGFGPCSGKGNHFVKVGYVGIERERAGRDIANRGDAGRHTFEKAASRVVIRCMFATSALRDDESNPIDERHSDVAQWLLQVAEFKMRVGVDQAGNESNPTEIDHFAGICLSSNGDDPLAVDGYDAVFDRRLI